MCVSDSSARACVRSCRVFFEDVIVTLSRVQLHISPVQCSVSYMLSAVSMEALRLLRVALLCQRSSLRRLVHLFLVRGVAVGVFRFCYSMFVFSEMYVVPSPGTLFS